ncbi:MAG: DUF4845 domain-containing protein [Actinomycetota bacterium]
MEKLKILIGLAVIAGGFYVAWNLIPPYFHNYQLQDELDDIARKDSYYALSEDEVKKHVMEKAKEDAIHLKEDQIKVSYDGSALSISVKYHVHVDLAVHPVDLDFAAVSYNKRI